MAIALVGSPETGGNTASATSLVTATANHVAGNALVVFTILGTGGTVTASTISNTAGDSWSFLTGTFVDDPSGNRYLGFYTPSTNGNANDAITLPILSASVYRAYVVFQISGAAPTSFDAANANTVGGGVTVSVTTGTIVVTAPGLICAAGAQGSASGFTPGTGYTGGTFAITGDANQYYFYEYKLVSASEAATGTIGTTTSWAISGASFKGASAPAGGGGPLTFNGNLIHGSLGRGGRLAA